MYKYVRGKKGTYVREKGKEKCVRHEKNLATT